MPFLNDLFWVGPTKPLGYLPISTIEEEGKSPGEIAEWANSAGLHSQKLSEFECRVCSGAVYVWDESALEALLQENADILERSGWPIAPCDFVLRVAAENAHDPALYELVGVAFNDFRFREKREHVRAVSLSSTQIAMIVGRPLAAIQSRAYRLRLKSGRPPTRTNYGER